jgi:hypothetical protein
MSIFLIIILYILSTSIFIPVNGFTTDNHPETNLTCQEGNYFTLDQNNNTICQECDPPDNSNYGTYITDVWSSNACFIHSQIDNSVSNGADTIVIIVFVISMFMICFSGYKHMSFTNINNNPNDDIRIIRSFTGLILAIYFIFCIQLFYLLMIIQYIPVAINVDYTPSYKHNIISYALFIVHIYWTFNLLTKLILPTSILYRVNDARIMLCSSMLDFCLYLYLSKFVIHQSIPVLDRDDNPIYFAAIDKKYTHDNFVEAFFFMFILKLICVLWYTRFLSNIAYRDINLIPRNNLNNEINLENANLVENNRCNNLITVSENDEEIRDVYHTADKCVICLSGVPKVIFLPCKHKVVCLAEGCYKQLSNCPICRTNINKCVYVEIGI